MPTLHTTIDSKPVTVVVGLKNDKSIRDIQVVEGPNLWTLDSGLLPFSYEKTGASTKELYLYTLNKTARSILVEHQLIAMDESGADTPLEPLRKGKPDALDSFYIPAQAISQVATDLEDKGISQELIKKLPDAIELLKQVSQKKIKGRR